MPRFALTASDFTPHFEADPEDSTLVKRPEHAERLAKYLGFHGLQLPPTADAQATFELCIDLRWTYGQAVRLSACGRAREVPGFCAELTQEQRYFARAVGEQASCRAQTAAKVLFTSAERAPFLR